MDSAFIHGVLATKADGLDEEIRTAWALARGLLEYFGERQLVEPQGGWGNETYGAVEKFFSTIRESRLAKCSALAC